MSKITQYLNEHLLGEVTANDAIRRRFARDGSVLTILPELVVHPKITNDIRKVARFSWQLAEKGHILPLITRGGGSNKTGAAIGKGIVVNTLSHLNDIIYVSSKSKDLFVHTQPGVTFKDLNSTLKTHGLIVPSYPDNSAYSTVGGAVADNSGGLLSGHYGTTGKWVKRLEVVLANGDLIEASRISRHDLDKKKGLQTFEGELYRKIDGIIEDNQSVIYDKITKGEDDNVGYPGVAKVKQRNGSFDLTPLFVGSQGTLGIISEVVLQASSYAADESVIVATFNDASVARSAANSLMPLQPVSMEYLDGELYKMAHAHGKKYLFSADNSEVAAVLLVSFNDASGRIRKRKVKKLLKKLSKLETAIYTSDNHSTNELYAVREVIRTIVQPESIKESVPSLIDGASVSLESREMFVRSLGELSTKDHLTLPLTIDWLSGVVRAYPTMHLDQVSDKQKVFKLINDYYDLVAKFGGNLAADGAEGRLRATATHNHLDPEVLDVYEQIKLAFDPYSTLNPGVKQKNDLRTLVVQLNADYDLTDFAQYSPLN